VLDRTLASSFVPNDTRLGGHGGSEGQTPTLALITGPNMAGKSTYIRQVALIALLAHVGSFVPAARAEIGVLDAILTRIGSADEIHSGQSTFMVEMTETANILHHATARSLVILDEIGRGTSTLDGLSLAWAITETLAARSASTLFATHYHELTQLADTLPGVTNLHVSVREWNDEVVFLHKIVPGRADRSYGIHVARLAGLPRETVARAKEVLELLGTVEVADALSGRVQKVVAAPRARQATPPQLSLFTEYVEHPVVQELRAVDLNALTPLAAFDLVRRLAGRA
jgi:DNA mismatch repair protein MutS